MARKKRETRTPMEGVPYITAQQQGKSDRGKTERRGIPYRLDHRQKNEAHEELTGMGLGGHNRMGRRGRGTNNSGERANTPQRNAYVLFKTAGTQEGRVA